MTVQSRAAVWRTLWRWHFYAGLFVVPFILILSLTGAIYLFKPDYERWEEAPWRNLPANAPRIDADAQLAAAITRHPGATLKAYRLPQGADDAAMIVLATPGGERQLVVSPFGGRIVADLAPNDRLMPWLADLHGRLLIGQPGDWLVELAGSWAIVMVITGLFLWWPRDGAGAAGLFYPRLRSGRRLFWRDIHAVTGMWISGLALVLLLSALPWTGVWGNVFRTVKQAAGVDVRKQDWRAGSRSPVEDHTDHDMIGMAMPMTAPVPAVSLSAMVAVARPLALAPPMMIVPPGASPDWIVRSEAQDRTLRASHSFDATTGTPVSHEVFGGKPVVDKVVGYGISWHEGVLFGRINQAIGVLTALGMFTLATSALVLWWRRRPDGVLGAPPVGIDPRRLAGAMLLLCGLAVFLPLLGLSLLVVALLEWAILRRIPPLARWLGLATA